jgi:DNA-binding CsgD family transcriptional regulator
MSASFTAATLADLGRAEEADEAARECLRMAVAFDDPMQQIQMNGILGRLALLRGDVAEARRLLDDLPTRMLTAGHLNPGAMPWPEAIEALVRSGELTAAAQVLAQFDELAVRASRWARAAAARSRGLLRLAAGDADGAVAAVDAGLTEEGGTYPFERGRLLLALGTAHRHARRGRTARAALDEAVAVFEGIGATTWREQAEAELRRVSGRRPGGEGLTTAERRVAELAASGRHNKEIAATLYLSVGTVEAHLSRVYRKLGLRSRTELAGRLRPSGDEVAER